ncbi:MAG: chemotaxis-specific protein-glutamate methyltransferase CheB [Leptospiraceae bacterium]|nr:chemotaxis-specific protein-glutamate methyltransferase CheB [Leptospiraceae bacterium]
MYFHVLLVDDSRLVRFAVRDILSQIDDIRICGEVNNGEECLQYLEQARAGAGTHVFPDLIIMDVEMPVLDGLSTLKEFQRRNIHVPVVMLSVLTQQGAITTFRALDLGALDFVPKPSPDSGLNLNDVEWRLLLRVNELIIQKKESARLKTPPALGGPGASVGEWAGPTPQQARAEAHRLKSVVRPEILVIGASTGGPQALQKIFVELPGDFPVPVLVVQHMPPVFTHAFAGRLDSVSALSVSEAVEGDSLLAGHAYVAPGDRHMVIDCTRKCLRITTEPPRNSHRPSIDVTLESTVQCFGSTTAAVLMTGMGRDGVDGFQRIHEQGGVTIAQDEASSVVFGMNRRAIESNSVNQVVALKNMVAVLSAYFDINR